MGAMLTYQKLAPRTVPARQDIREVGGESDSGGVAPDGWRGCFDELAGREQDQDGESVPPGEYPRVRLFALRLRVSACGDSAETHAFFAAF